MQCCVAFGRLLVKVWTERNKTSCLRACLCARWSTTAYEQLITQRALWRSAFCCFHDSKEETLRAHLFWARKSTMCREFLSAIRTPRWSTVSPCSCQKSTLLVHMEAHQHHQKDVGEKTRKKLSSKSFVFWHFIRFQGLTLTHRVTRSAAPSHRHSLMQVYNPVYALQLLLSAAGLTPL